MLRYGKIRNLVEDARLTLGFLSSRLNKITKEETRELRQALFLKDVRARLKFARKKIDKALEIIDNK